MGSTPTTWSAKRQTSVQTSTFVAEFIALKRAVEEAITIRYHLRSMGVVVSEATEIYADTGGASIRERDFEGFTDLFNIKINS